MGYVGFFKIRRSAFSHKVRYTTTLSDAEAFCTAMRNENRMKVTCLQDIEKVKLCKEYRLLLVVKKN